jgi:FlaA1/EpsC-like NDP-sugar epimerase
MRGQPLKIADLARRMTELLGCKLRNDENPEGDISIEVIGMRAGEKLY